MSSLRDEGTARLVDLEIWWQSHRWVPVSLRDTIQGMRGLGGVPWTEVHGYHPSSLRDEVPHFNLTALHSSVNNVPVAGELKRWWTPPRLCPPCRRMKNSVTELPFNTFVGIQAAADPDKLLQLPGGGQYLNHLGTVHASALLALAEASSGEFLLRHFVSSDGVVPVVRRMEAKFRKPANGAVSSKARAEPEALEQLKGDLAGKGRALISIAVELHDESGAQALTATVEWFIQRLDA